MSYKNLEIWQLAREVVIDVHQMTLTLPQFEMYEKGAQIRKSSKNVRSTIVEGYGRRRYKADYIKFLVYAHASNDETFDHLETLFDTRSLKDENLFRMLTQKIDKLGRKINTFISSVEKNHKSQK